MGWTKEHNGGSTQIFVIKYQEDSENTAEMYSGSVTEISNKKDYKYIVYNLKSGVPYYVRVISGNAIGNNTSSVSPRTRGITLRM